MMLLAVRFHAPESSLQNSQILCAQTDGRHAIKDGGNLPESAQIQPSFDKSILRRQAVQALYLIHVFIY